MSVNVAALAEACQQYGIAPDCWSTENTAHILLERIAVPPGTVLQWGACRDWQVEMYGERLFAGSFEDCVVELARRCAAPTSHNQ